MSMLHNLHDPDSGLYHGDVPVDPNFPPPLRAATQAAEEPSSGPLASGAGSDDEAPEAPQEAATAPAYDDLTVDELREEMRSRGLGYAGLLKADLVEALQADDEKPQE